MAEHKQKQSVVLVVEDEPLTLMGAVDLVEEEGFEAISARNADDAIIILENRDDVSVIFTDINMPGSMDGLKLAHAVRDRWPPIDIIVTSALDLGGPQRPPHRRMPARGIFLRKPYTGRQIARALHTFAA
jgi:CheY-like chemotaxis protein